MADYDGEDLKKTLKRKLEGVVPATWIRGMDVYQRGDDAWELGEESAEGSMRIDFPTVDFTLAGFRSCCGMMVMSDLSLGEPTRYKLKNTNAILSVVSKMINVGGLMYITSDEQGYLHPVLKTLGFKELKGSETINPRTGNGLLTWIKKVNQ